MKNLLIIICVLFSMNTNAQQTRIYTPMNNSGEWVKGKVSGDTIILKLVTREKIKSIDSVQIVLDSELNIRPSLIKSNTEFRDRMYRSEVYFILDEKEIQQIYGNDIQSLVFDDIEIDPNNKNLSSYYFDKFFSDLNQ